MGEVLPVEKTGTFSRGEKGEKIRKKKTGMFGTSTD